MEKKTFLIILLAIVSMLPFQNLSAQKRPLNPSVYDSWESVSTPTVPYNGKYLLYSVAQQEGDRVLYLYDLQTNERIAIERGKDAVISRDGRTLLYKIAPFHKETRDAKIKKKKSADMPKDTLALMDLKSRTIKTFPALSSLKYGDELEKHVVFQTENKGEKSDKDAGKPLYIVDIRSGGIDTVAFVDNYSVSPEGNWLTYVTKPSKKDTLAQKELILYRLDSKESRPLLSGDKKATIDLPVFDEEEGMMAFFAQLDTLKESSKYKNIYFSNLNASDSANVLISKHTKGIPEGWMIADKGRLKFSKDGKNLYLAIKPIPEEKDTTIAEFERVKLDIWVWDADYLPTYKKARKTMFDNMSYAAVYHFNTPGSIVQLADEQLPRISIPEDIEGDFVLAVTDKPYRVQSQWELDAHSDLYKVNIKTGDKKLIVKDLRASSAIASPKGNYYTWYDVMDKNWYLYDMTAGKSRNLTSSLGVAFWNEDMDMPMAPNPYGYPIWFEDESSFLLSDRNDLWMFDPKGVSEPYLFTEGIGKSENERFSVVQPIHDPDARGNRYNYLKRDYPIYLSSFDRTTREKGIYIKDITKKKGKMMKLVEGPFSYRLSAMSLSYGYPNTQRPPRKLAIPIFIYTKGNFQNPQDVYITRDIFRTQEQISAINPQQKEYNWGSVEMVSWMTLDSIKAEGLLFKPENFDPSKKYPMIVYFYEKDSDGLYEYRSPAPSRSVINIPYYVSNGYLVFNPDIYYFDGHPGQSAMRSIMPGVDMLCKNSWVDSDNMAIQGQSWGGYQVAYMITQTDRFKAAEAGAPVSNMTSAYGGIRWESGVTRQFQYEQSQSRIGKNLWDGFDLYYENSPLFFAPNVKTPLLIMHNDNDGAVPWYQGIEYFTALRRLGKPAWMLQYNGEAHNLRERHNCKDLTIKIAEFFDYYLKGASEPDWMKNK